MLLRVFTKLIYLVDSYENPLSKGQGGGGYGGDLNQRPQHYEW